MSETNTQLETVGGFTVTQHDCVTDTQYVSTLFCGSDDSHRIEFDAAMATTAIQGKVTNPLIMFFAGLLQARVMRP